MTNVPFSEMSERWSEILEFPGYLVSDWGRVLNERRGTYITPTSNTRSICIVGLMRNGIQQKRSLTLLVANAFLSRPTNESFDTPINLDGDRFNNCYVNLKWRPLWFARKYSAQFSDGHFTYNYPIEDVETREVYPNSMSAAITNGILDTEIYAAMINNLYVFPTGQVFRDAR